MPAGQVIGIVGPSGSGKSTLAKLIQRLYVPESGRVLVDGVDLAMVDHRLAAAADRHRAAGERAVQPLDAREYRARRSRHADGTSDRGGRASPARMNSFSNCRKATTRSSASAAARLSGGQRQRIAIARALITDPRILIFDEATSALDYESERVIQQNMTADRAGPNGFHHRASPVRRCGSADRIITLERGRIVEEGTHDAADQSQVGATPRSTECRWAFMKSAKPEIVAFRLPEAAAEPRGRRRTRLPAGGARDRRNAALADRPRHLLDHHRECSVWRWLGRCFGKVDIVATASGKIVPSGRTKVIQPLEIGVVSAIDVQRWPEGEGRGYADRARPDHQQRRSEQQQ